MSVLPDSMLSRPRTVEASDYDHQIFLLDSTRPDEPQRPSISISIDPDSRLEPAESASPRSPETPQSRKFTLREELAHRKYAKWNERRDDTARPSSSGSDEPFPDHVDASRDLGRRGSRGSRRFSSGRQAVTPADERTRAVDILYENQRGSFMCGVPLFSHNSLLNFDPSPWTNAEFKNSPVDVTTAQVPDPTWEWEWKSWYVDMSADVDDEGWEYSFSFSPLFAWHGNYVWFHSFVRRRRWLRARLKRSQRVSHDGPTSARPSHDGSALNPEYFEVRSRSGSRASSMLSGSGEGRGSHSSRGRAEIGDDLQETHDLETLTRVLKSGRIDREKIDAVKGFVEHCDEDLPRLAEMMATIMSSLVFQASRRQLLALLLQALDQAQSGEGEKEAKETEASEDKGGRVESLARITKAADEQVRRLEYWSDIKDMTRQGESRGATDGAQGWGERWQGVDGSGPDDVGEEEEEEGGDRGEGGVS